MSIKQQTPQLRLTGFSKDWVQKKLVDEVIFFSGLTYTPSDVVDKSGTLVLRSSNVQNGAITLGDNVYVNSEVVNSQNVEVGDSIVVVRNGSRNLIGKHAMITKPMDNTVIGAFMTGIRAPVPSFFNTLLDTQEFHDEVSKNLGATINQITGGMFKAMSFYLPESDEQTAIGNLFQNIDQTIALQRRKHEQTQTLKKSLLSKMFPQKGQSQPEIRLKGFSGDWAKSKLGDLAHIRRGASPRPIQDPRWFDENSKVGWLRISDVTKQDGRIYSIEQKLSLEGQAQTLVLNEPHLILSIAATIGKPVVNYLPTGIHDGFVVFLNLQADREFLFQWLEVFRTEWQKLGQSGSQINLNSEIVKRQSIMLPSLQKEQTAIGQFFKQLDDTISLQAKQLKTLDNLKKALLAKMFV